MCIQIKALTVLLFALFALLCTSHRCGNDYVWKQRECIACSSLSHTVNQLGQKISAGDICSCQTGYYWNEAKVQCSNMTFIEGSFETNQEYEYNSRLLQLTCDATLGFVYFSNSYIATGNPETCINCRNILYGSAATISTTDCSCRSNFDFRSNSKTCYCNNLLDPITQQCLACEDLGTDATTYDGCYNCDLPYLRWGYHGCVNCKKLANNGGQQSCCNTAGGYTFSSTLGRCICQSGWGIDSTGKCASCGSNTDCSGKKRTYFFDNHETKFHTFILNYDPTIGTSGGCKAGYAYKKNLVTNQIIGCGCSKAAKYYLSGSTCSICSSPPSSISKSNCEACSVTSGFWSGPYECVYCKGDSNSLGTATVSGCNCKPNYYWNLNTGKCECDFARGFIGPASACIDCSKIQNTGSDMIQGACSCIAGYKWNSATNKCDCDTSSPFVFSSDSQCVSCAIADIPGSTGTVAADGKSCICSKGYYWHPGKADCLCDANQNYFVDTDGFCKQCYNLAMSIGLGFSQSCVCSKGLQWSSTLKKCICPSGYVQMSSGCVECSKATFPNGATLNECTTCLNARGFAKKNGDCYFCADQFMVNAAVTGGTCTCSAASMTWYPDRGGCGCNMDKNLLLQYSSGVYSCQQCSWIYTGDPVTCACPYQYQVYDPITNTCTNCMNLPNSVYDQTNNVCNCKSGYVWSYETFPLKCVKSSFVSVGKGYYSSKKLSSTLCSALSSSADKTACTLCTTAGGYVWIINKDVCLKCSEVTDATGVALENGCVCNTGKYFDAIKMTCVASTCSPGFIYNPNSGACDLCDPIKSVTVQSNCVSCVADSNSLGYAKSASQCACKSGNTWSNGACSNGDCNLANSIWIGTLCFVCPSDNKGTGVPDGTTKCGCSNNYRWVATLTGGSCQCPSNIAYIATDSNCFFCQASTLNAGTANSAGNGCNCKKNYAWSEADKICKCDSSVSGFPKTDGNCFICSSTIDPKFDGTIVVSGSKSTCGCKDNYEFTPAATGTGEGTCTCPSATSIISSGKCIKCSNDPKSDAGKLDGTTKCACANGWIWSTTSNKCVCDSTVSGFPLLNGNCFICSATADPNFSGSDGTKCTCSNSFSFVSSNTGGSCQCLSPKTIVNDQCVGCPVAEFSDGTSDGNGGCTCLKNYVWQPSSNSCVCNQDVNGFIASNSNCVVCTSSDANPLFNGINSIGTQCVCSNGFQFETSDNKCKCSSPNTLLTALNQCVTCPTVQQGGTGNANSEGNACQCSNGKIWSISQGCSCLASQVVLTSGACFSCGATGTFTGKTKVQDKNECTCANANYFWNPDAGLCDCGDGKALVITGSKGVCVTCDETANSNGKADFKSCTCASDTLTWNAAYKSCICSATQYYANEECNQCTAEKFTKALTNPKISTECVCLTSSLIWSATDEMCKCKKANQVIFIVKNALSCKACSSSIRANTIAISPTECQCPSGFVWANNIGCVCEDQNAILLATKPPSCLVCDSTIYSSGPSSDKKSCACLGNLKWNKKTNTCGCLKASQALLSNDDDTYSCFQCKNAAANTATPVIGGNQCTCTNPALTWYDSGMCGCSDITSMVWVGKPVNKCVTCDPTINSIGKDNVNSKTCSCVSPLFFINGICDCGTNLAMVTQGIDTISCINCKDASRYLKAKISPKSCSCVSKNLVWDSVEGYCKCPNTDDIIIGSSSSITCKSCVGRYIKEGPPIDTKTCQCLLEAHVFSSLKGVLSCGCPLKNSITSYGAQCIQCTATKKILTVSECACAKSDFWDTVQQKCVKCTDISGAIAGNGMSCKCSDKAKVWDVVKRQCISPCAGSACLDCSKLAFATDDQATSVDPAVGGFQGGLAIKKLLQVTTTNYAELSQYQCGCSAGYKWDKYRLSCVSYLLIAIP